MMLQEIKASDYWVGGIKYVNTTAVGDEGQKYKIHEPAHDAASDRWYAVTIGLQVGIFLSW